MDRHEEGEENSMKTGVIIDSYDVGRGYFENLYRSIVGLNEIPHCKKEKVQEEERDDSLRGILKRLLRGAIDLIT